MTIEEEILPVLTGVTAQAIVDNAKRLGLTWTLRMATVTSITAGSNQIIAIFDGDTEPIGMINMAAISLTVGARVYAIFVPPSGNFVVGLATNPMFAARQTLTATASSVTFSNIPINLRSLTLRWKARSDVAAVISQCAFQINGNSGANYTFENIQGNGAAVAAGTATTTSAFGGYSAGATAPTNLFGGGRVEFFSWDLTATFLHWTIASGVMASGALYNGGAGAFVVVGPWTSLRVFPNTGSWIAGSDFQLFGLAS